MRQEVVQDFLNLPGIAGVALMNGRSRPYFCGVDQTLNFQQKEALAQGIQQVIETTPPGFNFFEFQFSRHQVYIYKLNHGVILLVLATSSLVYSSYAGSVEQLKRELQEDVINTIATFRLMAGTPTLSKQNGWKQTKADPATALETITTLPKDAWFQTPRSAALTPDPPLKNSAPTGTVTVTLQEAIAAINQLSKFAVQYLGSAVVTNYWKITCPMVPWLQQFQVERSAQISFAAQTFDQSPDHRTLTPEQQQWIQDWVEAFLDRCAKVIRDFPKTARQQVLGAQHQFLLRDNPPEPLC